MRRIAALALSLAAGPCQAQQLFLESTGSFEHSADVVVYGATGAGCVAAIAASRSGANSVMLLSQTGHVGGMLTGGLMHTDSANDTVIQGITREFFVRTESEYPGRPTDANYPPKHSPPGWLFESKVGERVLNQMLSEAGVVVVRKVVGVSKAQVVDGSLQKIATEGAQGAEFSGKVWIDASYEGDVLARVATMTWGREGVAQYDETDAGRQGGEGIGATVNPYWDVSAETLHVIPHVAADLPAGLGEEDRWVEPYDFRLCFTDSPGNSVPITKPPSYNASEWELWRRIYAESPPKSLSSAGLTCLGPIPHDYTDCGTDMLGRNRACKKCDMLGMNHGTDMLGGSWGYPNGTTAERDAIWRAHVEFTRGLLWFWASDPAVPKRVRDEINTYGHCSDEYDADSDPPHWPHQLYVREAKRLVGDFVWTEHRPAPALIARSVGLGSYSFDCHFVSRVVHREGEAAEHRVVKEGRVDVHHEQVPSPSPSPSPSPGPQYACVGQRCVEVPTGGSSGDAACDGQCSPLSEREWLAVRALSDLSGDGRMLTVQTLGGKNPTFIKKSERLAAELPASVVSPVYDGQVLQLARPARVLDPTYYLIELEPEANSKLEAEASSVTMPPYEMPYDVLLPKASEVGNVLAAVAISASHVRFNAIRMEPTWMILGQAAGSAAAMAIQNNVRVQDVDVPALQDVLLAQGQKIAP